VSVFNRFNGFFLSLIFCPHLSARIRYLRLPVPSAALQTLAFCSRFGL